MSTKIKYAYLKQQTWLYRRNYPKHLQPVLGQALKQSLKTGDARVAKARVIEINASFAKFVSEAEAQVNSADHQPASQEVVIRVPIPKLQRAIILGQTTVSDLAGVYLHKRSQELSPGTYKSVRFSLGLLVSVLGGRKINSLCRTDGQAFLNLIAKLSPDVAKSASSKGASLKQLVALGTEDVPPPNRWQEIEHNLQAFPSNCEGWISFPVNFSNSSTAITTTTGRPCFSTTKGSVRA